LRTYVVTVQGGLLGIERTIGLLRRRRVSVSWLALHPSESPTSSHLIIRVSSSNHEQLRRQLARLIEVTGQIDFVEENHDNAA
jgi:acetolactate synthase small subunit